jgi:acetylornithine/succinyldiaminopimelate/putrescine aminotransferase
MLSNYQKKFLSDIAQTSDAPIGLDFKQAKGIYLISENDEQYIDLISGISVSNLGHSNPEIIKAVQEQAAKYMHLMVYGEYLLAPQIIHANLLKENIAEHLNNIYFVNSGSEAIEGALKLAKRYTGRTEIISFYNAYHGGTHAALSIIGSEEYKQAFRPLLPDIKQLHYNAFEEIEAITEKTAAVVVECVQAEAGIVLPEKDYLERLDKRCKEVGALLIVDEVQTGMGRTAKLFAYMHHQIKPDIICVAKAFGGGMPLGAFISSKEIMHSLSHKPVLGHITTFGGHPVCCAAGHKALELLINSNIIEEVEEKASLFVQILSQNNKINAISHKGLMIALEFDNFEINKKIIDLCIDNKIIVDWFLFADNKMRISPPLIITKEEIEKACAIINSCIDKVIA